MGAEKISISAVESRITKISIMGLAINPETAVLPMCSIRWARALNTVRSELPQATRQQHAVLDLAHAPLQHGQALRTAVECSSRALDVSISAPH